MHARDAALLRQELDGCALVFSGHTRTTDVERLVQVGWVREVTTARRASPRVVLSATREGESRGAQPLSTPASTRFAGASLRISPVKRGESGESRLVYSCSRVGATLRYLMYHLPSTFTRSSTPWPAAAMTGAVGLPMRPPVPNTVWW